MKRIILTGERDRGKTAFCRLLAAGALSRGLSVTGIISLKEMKGEKLSALWASDCREEEKRMLARFIPEDERSPSADAGSKTPSWSFFPEAFLWGNALMAGAPPADLFILDEAGPLEFSSESPSPQSDNAWTAGMERMDRAVDRIALAVVRPELVDRARLLWQDAAVLNAPDCRKTGTEAGKLIKQIIG